MLKIDWCGHDAARHACLNWHYSKTMPVSKSACLGVWEDGSFRGAVVFSSGANLNIGAPYDLANTECIELVRVALRSHKTQVSRIIAICLKVLRKTSPGIRLVVSYADSNQGHHGGIYQAGGWVYVGQTEATKSLFLGEKSIHKRAFTGNNFDNPALKMPPGAQWRMVKGKHKYLMPLDEAMRRQIEPLRQPYPKALDPMATRSHDGKCATGVASTPAAQAGGGVRKDDRGAPAPPKPLAP